MKRIVKGFAPLLLVVSSMNLLSSCGNGTKLPITSYEKVQFALNGVESSLSKGNRRNLQSNISNESLAKLMLKGISNDSLNTIYSMMEVEEETSNPSFEYDEPPMIQFQYLKAVYEEMGEDFKFDTKYINTLTGSIYYDFETRTAPNEDRYLNEYSFILSLSLNIDENDLIRANVGFDLTFLNQGVNHHEKMYVTLLLDYDMDEVSPTYELSMNALTDLLEYENEDEKYFNDEYDYVKVEKNSIKEWRKFGICSPGSLSNYQGEDFIYKYSTLRAFKDSKKYRIENSFNQDKTLKEAVIDCLDLSNSLNGYTSFFNKEGTVNQTIKTVIDRFSAIYGKDIVNNLVYTGGSEVWVDDKDVDPENLFLRVISTGGYEIYNDAKIDDLFNPNIGWNEKGITSYLTIYYKSGEDVTLKTYNDFNDVNVKVRSTSYSKTKWIDIKSNDIKTFTEYIKDSGFVGTYNLDLSYFPITLEFDISLKDKPEVKLQTNLTLSLYNNDSYLALLRDYELTKNYLNEYAVVKDSIPEFEGNSLVSFSPNIYDAGTNGSIRLDATDGLSALVNDYINKVKGLKFVEDTYNSTYTKRINDDYVLVLTIYPINEKEDSASIRFVFKNEQKPAETITDVLNGLINNNEIVIPTFNGDYDYSVENNVIRIKTDDNTLVENYINSFATYGFIIYDYLGTNAAIKYYERTFYQIRNMGKSIAVEIVSSTLSAAGDFNSWNVNDTTSEFKDLVMENNNLYLTKDFNVKQNEAFKFVLNHSFNNGGYGFSYGGAEESFVSYFESGENDNIVARETGTYLFKVRINFYYVFDAPENNIHVLDLSASLM